MEQISALAVQTVFIAFFGWASFAKLTRHPHMVKEFTAFELPYGLALFAGVWEAAASLLLLAGYADPLCRLLGFGLLVPAMGGAAIINFWKRPAAFGFGVIVLLLVPAALFAVLDAQRLGLL